MARINPVDASVATDRSREMLDGVKRQLGWVPNIFATFAHSPAALEGFMAMNRALTKGALGAALREQIALTVAGRNSCDYCASAHSALAKAAGVSASDAAQNLCGEASDERTRAALTFAANVVEKRGLLTDDDLKAVRSGGFSDGEIVEILANVAGNIFTNYFNHLAGTDIDFPLVTTDHVSACA